METTPEQVTQAIERLREAGPTTTLRGVRDTLRVIVAAAERCADAERERDAARAEAEALRVDAGRYMVLAASNPSISIGCSAVPYLHGYTRIEVGFLVKGAGKPTFPPRLDALADALAPDAGQ